MWIGFDQPKTIIANGFAGDLAVPLWTRFMKVATAGAKPDWYSAPKDIVAAQVCRVSGLLPGAFCDRIITEYFARSAAPTRICQAHSFEYDAALLAAVIQPAQELPPVPPVLAQASPPSEPPATAPIVQPASTDTSIVSSPEPPKKRGFWAKVLGKGKGKDTPRGDDASK